MKMNRVCLLKMTESMEQNLYSVFSLLEFICAVGSGSESESGGSRSRSRSVTPNHSGDEAPDGGNRTP